MMDVKGKRWYQDKYLYFSLGICLLLAMCSFLYFIFRGNGAFTLMTDFNSQQIPFSIAMSDAVKNGGMGWMWNVDLGTSFVGAYSFYNLGSPFFWMYLLFPAMSFPYLAGWMYILKYASAGAFAYLYIRRFVQKGEAAVLGAVLYAFSGFQSVNLIFHFHDVTAFFPLLLLGLEKMAVDGKKGYFAAAVFMNCLLNYFFFPGEVIFLVIYFICRFGIKKSTVALILRGCVEGIIGIGMACCLFLPSLLFITGNPKASNSIFADGNLVYSVKRYLEIIRGILLPAEPMYAQSVIEAEDFTSTSAYLPGVGMVLVFSYVLKKKDWIRGLLSTVFVISLLPMVNSAFYAFSQDYRRWWYMPVLIMALASAKVMDEKNKFDIRKGAGIVSGIITVLAVSMAVLTHFEVIELYSFQYFTGSVLITLLCSMLLYLFAEKRKMFPAVVWGMILFMSAATTIWMIHAYRITAPEPQELVKKWEADRELPLMDLNYRYDADNSAECIGGVHSLRIYSSTITGSIYEMHRKMGLSRTPAIVLLDVPGVEQWLGGKYKIVEEPEGKRRIAEQNACPIGFTYETYVLASDFEQLDSQLRGISVLMGLVIPDEREKEVSEYLDRISVESIDENSLSYMDEYIKRNAEHIVNIYEMNAQGFRAETDNTEGTYAFFSVPYDSGWTAYVNGQKADILNINGLMAVRIERGKVDIQFIYETPGLKVGILLSILFTVIFLGYMCCFKKVDKG